MEINKIHNIDCVEGMKKLNDESVDLVVTSPPYDNLRKYNDYSFNFENVVKELYRILKQGGVIVWIVADSTVNGSETGTSFKQALYFKDSGFNIHDTMIYMSEKPPLNHNRYEQKFEYMFVFSKGKPKTFNPIKIKCNNIGVNKKSTFRENDGKTRLANKIERVKQEKIKGNIWEYKTGYLKTTTDKIAYNHPAIFPEKLVSDHIYSWSNKKDLVLDPFMGSGTTAKMCLLLNRNFIGFEISEEYCEIANKRIDYLQRQQKLF